MHLVKSTTGSASNLLTDEEFKMHYGRERTEVERQSANPKKHTASSSNDLIKKADSGATSRKAQDNQLKVYRPPSIPSLPPPHPNMPTFANNSNFPTNAALSTAIGF